MSKLADRIIVYADGSCLGNPGPGGWGAVILDGRDAPELSGSNPQTTNNRMEITAVIEALRALPASTPALIRTDSQYVIKTITDGWRRNKNQDLWALLDAELRGRDVRFEWVKGHADDPMNERADALAREAAGGALTRAARSLAPSPRAEPPVSAEGRAAKAARPSALTAHDARIADALAPLLRPGERLARCVGCGRDFVAPASHATGTSGAASASAPAGAADTATQAGALYCALAGCQLAARQGPAA